MDILTVIGLLLGVGAVLGGQHLDGGSALTLVQPSMLLIVVGGTLGATMVQSSPTVFRRGFAMLTWAAHPPRLNLQETIGTIIQWSKVARKEGLLGLESIAEQAEDPFARKGLKLLVDGCEPQVMRTIMEIEVTTRESIDREGAGAFHSMGRYSPNIGVIGAVMGLIPVMNTLSDPSKLGEGITAALVALIYGVGFAQLLCIPLGNKLRSVVDGQARHRRMIIEGIVAIAEGENPRNIETKLQSFLG